MEIPNNNSLDLDFTKTTLPETLKNDFSSLDGKVANVKAELDSADNAIRLADKYEDPKLKELALMKKAQLLATLAALAVPEINNVEDEKLAARLALENSHDFSRPGDSR